MLTTPRPARALVAAALLGSAAALPAQSDSAARHAQERAILSQLVSINSSSGTLGVDTIGRTIADRLRQAGFADADVQRLGPTPALTSVVVRYRGRSTGRKPILVMAHMDVVPALDTDWSKPPFRFTEDSGHYYARGVVDNKAGLAAIVATFERWKRAGWVPDRDIIAVLTADEETDGAAIKWLLANHRPLSEAEYAVNSDAGGVTLVRGRPLSVSVQASEKVFVNVMLTARNPGGHSSVPRDDNAIYDLGNALVRLSTHRFPVRLNEVTRAFFREGAAAQPDSVARLMRAVAGGRTDQHTTLALGRIDAFYNSVMRTTCVATRLYGGHADNALPQQARALVNCRMLPDESPDNLVATLRGVVGDRVTAAISRDYTLSPASPLRGDVLGAVRDLARERFPGAAVIPEMSTGATDGLFTRNAGIPTFGLFPLAGEQGDPPRAHGRDERVNAAAFHAAVSFWDALIQRLAGPSTPLP
jgi:acetylornithine deacetylase/succinyl-diaminopimelate desuccinylase-like protein